MYYDDGDRGAAWFRDRTSKAQTLGLPMAIGTIFGYVVHTVTATPGNRSWVTHPVYLAAAIGRNTFLMDAAAIIALIPALTVVDLALGAVAINTNQEA